MKLFLSYLETLIKLWESGKLDADDFVRELRTAIREEREILECDSRRENIENADRFFNRVKKLLRK